MSREKPSIPKGTRDFLPNEMIRRKYIFNTIETAFQLYGFQPIETPSMEHTSTLLGKYGEEGDKLLFRILNSGDFLSDAGIESLAELSPQQLAARICEKGLRYDLTVPFARFVVQHRNELSFPFRRYQMQAVWRADKPQKGRYREFYQCDADVIGSTALLNEAELIKLVEEVFSRLGLKIKIRLNNRKILAGLAAYMGVPDKLTAITVSIDKYDKIGKEGVVNELSKSGLSDSQIHRIHDILDFSGIVGVELSRLDDSIGKTEIGREGIEELKELREYLTDLGVSDEVYCHWLPLARGLDYYTGTIIEVVCPDHPFGSLCGGGRYDDLTGIFGLDGLSGVGISFGADRIYDALLALNLFPVTTVGHTRLLFVNFGGEEERTALKLLNSVRERGIPAEIYPDTAKLKKQLSYANAQKIKYVALIGEAERQSGQLSLKDMESGDQYTLDFESLMQKLHGLL